MSKTMKMIGEEIIPRKDEELKVRWNGEEKDIINRYSRKYAWEVIHETRGHLLNFRDLFLKVKDRVLEALPKTFENKIYRRDFCLLSLIVPGSNIAVFSQNRELWVTYAHQLTGLIKYVEYYNPAVGRGNSREMRASARLLLSYLDDIDLRDLRDFNRRTKGFELSTRSLTVLRGDFALIPERDRVVVTYSTRLSLRVPG